MSSKTTITLIVILILSLGYFIWSFKHEQQVADDNKNTENDNNTSFHIKDEMDKENVEDGKIVIAFPSVFDVMRDITINIKESNKPVSFRFLKRENFTFTLKTKKTYGLYQKDCKNNIRIKTVWDDLDGNAIKMFEVIEKDGVLYKKTDGSYEIIEEMIPGLMSPEILFDYIKNLVVTDQPMKFSSSDTVYIDKEGNWKFLDELSHSKRSNFQEKPVDIYKTRWEFLESNARLFMYLEPGSTAIAAGRFFFSAANIDSDYMIEFHIKYLPEDFTIKVFE